jgi:iron complex outermembrane recepter protein
MKKVLISIFTASVLVGSVYGETFDLGKINIEENISLKDKSFNDNVVFSEDIVNNEQKTIVEALNSVSGINIYNSGARNEQMITLRGFDVKHVPLYIDGIPIAVAYDGYVDFSRFTTFDLSQIEISKGLSSVLLGSNTFAGAVNLVTKKPTKEFEGTISAGTFSGKGKKAYINLGTDQGLFYVQLAGSYLSRDYYPLSDEFQATTLQQDNDKRNESDTEDKKINLKVGFTPNDTDEYAINYINQKADKGVPPTIYESGFPRYWDWNYWDKESIYFLSRTVFDDLYLKTRIFYDKFKNSLSIYTDNTYSTYSYGGVGNPSWYDDNTKGISIELGQLESGNNTIKAALHAKKDTHTEGGALQEEVYEMAVNTYSLGIEDTYRFSDNTKVIVGASYDKDDVQRADNTNFGSSGNYGSTPGGSDISGYGTVQEFDHSSANAFNPMIKIEHNLDDSLKVYGGMAKKTRLPSIKDRYSFRFKRFLPNPDLEEERSLNYELGFQKQFKNSTLKGSVFYMDIKDFIQSTYVDIYFGTNQQKQFKNIGKVRSKGFELSYLYMFDNGLTFDGSYTWQEVEDKEDQIEITNVAKNKVVLSLSHQVIKDLMANVSMHYSSSMKTNQTEPYDETGSMTVWNTKIIYDITKQLTYDVGVTNIFDKNYQLDYGFPEAGRVFFTNLTYKF